LNKYQIAKKYSRALINSVDTANAGKVIEEIEAFASVINSDKKLKLVFASRLFTEEERGKALSIALPRLNVSEETRKFLSFVVAEGHLGVIKEIIKLAIQINNERMKKARALVISPAPLSSNYIERLRTALKSMTQRDIEIENRTDESLIGGFIVKVGSTIYDSSLKGQLRVLRTTLMN